MEWNGKFYFEWPDFLGIVYAVPLDAIGACSVVDLPDKGQCVQLIESDGYVEILETRLDGADERKRFTAERILNLKGEANPTFAGSWEPLIPLIDATAMVNGLFTVSLPSEEDMRLKANEYEAFLALRARVSPRAASLLHLVDFDGDLRVELYRTGRCPH